MPFLIRLLLTYLTKFAGDELKKLFKRYWWVLVTAVVLLCVPKIVDILFSVHSWNFMSMHNIEAPDILGYLGSIIGGVCSFAAILVAIKQFSTEKKPIIIPRNKQFFAYLNFCGHMAFLENSEEEEDLSVETRVPIAVTLENVTDNAAIAFDLKIDYKNGAYYRAVCNLIGGEPSCLQSHYDSDAFINQGVFNSNSSKTLYLTTNLEFIVKGILFQLEHPESGAKTPDSRYNYFIRKSYKVAELIITTKDISGKSRSSAFDLELQITHLLCEKADYEVSFTFVMQK